MVSPAANMFANSIGKRVAKNIYFRLKEFKDCHWRLFEAKEPTEIKRSNLQFLFVYGSNEVCLFISDIETDMFVPMRDRKCPTQTYVLKKYEEHFEQCKRIICEEEGWKKDVLLLHKSQRRLIKALCNASLMEPNVFTETKKNHPKKFWSF